MGLVLAGDYSLRHAQSVFLSVRLLILHNPISLTIVFRLSSFNAASSII